MPAQSPSPGQCCEQWRTARSCRAGATASRQCVSIQAGPQRFIAMSASGGKVLRLPSTIPACQHFVGRSTHLGPIQIADSQPQLDAKLMQPALTARLHERLQQEGREPRRCRGPILHVLQLRARSHDAPRDPGDGAGIANHVWGVRRGDCSFAGSLIWSRRLNTSVDWVGLLFAVAILAFWGWLLRGIRGTPRNRVVKVAPPMGRLRRRYRDALECLRLTCRLVS
jgi:hypothetical protein